MTIYVAYLYIISTPQTKALPQDKHLKSQLNHRSLRLFRKNKLESHTFPFMSLFCSYLVKHLCYRICISLMENITDCLSSVSPFRCTGAFFFPSLCLPPDHPDYGHVTRVSNCVCPASELVLQLRSQPSAHPNTLLSSARWVAEGRWLAVSYPLCYTMYLSLAYNDVSRCTWKGVCSDKLFQLNYRFCYKIDRQMLQSSDQSTAQQIMLLIWPLISLYTSFL